MRYLLYLPFALLAGLIIGGWAPKSELKKAQQEIEELREQAAQPDNKPNMNVLTRIMRIPDRAGATRNKSSHSATNQVTQAEPGAPHSTTHTIAKRNVHQPRHRRSPEDLRIRINEAQDLWNTRVEIARSQLTDRLQLNQEQQASFDAVINAMNEQLYYITQDFADTLAAHNKLTPEDTVRAMNEMSTILTETYDAFYEFTPAGQQGNITEIELSDFIDPGIAEPLIDVQEILEQQAPQRNRRSRRRE